MLQRTEYPRPQLRREEWLSLNGVWQFAYDDEETGLLSGYERETPLPLKINVPFAHQTEASGLHDETPHSCVWYKRTFTAKKNKRAILNFNACDYETDVWVNGRHCITHVGGYTPFSTDVTPYLVPGENILAVRCKDPLDPAIPRGKQSWTGKQFTCWYIPTTGIWQSVWIDWVGDDYLASHCLMPDYDSCSVSGELVTGRGVADEAELRISLHGEPVKRLRLSLDGKRTKFSTPLLERSFVDAVDAWSPEHPNLFDVEITLFCAGRAADVTKTRFGLRKISAADGRITLNNQPLYQRLVLDQGYWEESGLTPPSPEAIKRDIELSIELGFNGARKHQKFEDPYFYYYAEELGFLCWCEMPSAYYFCAEEERLLSGQWREIVETARNFTSGIAYVPLNESWGVRRIVADRSQQNFARALYYATKALDPTRPVSTNDGWETPDATDLLGIHDYAATGSAFESYRREELDDFYPQNRRFMAEGCRSNGQPVLLTEFGGIALAGQSQGENWGYNEGAGSEKEFLARYSDLLRGVYQNPLLCGFCYTQLTDVQQEVNGLLYADRTPKFDLAQIRKITENRK
ncbi:MAG: glycoside hydrolase family 2 [Clostridia bacterium]|nr:glycoside hydrolase family 2 [Clostridia bacterium]